MSVLVFLGTALAGGVGAALRFLVDQAVRSRTRGSFPTGTAVVNLTGSFALGLVLGIADAAALPGEVVTLVGVGLLGGYTTFSTASVETVRLAQAGRWRPAVANALGVLVACTVAALAGWWLGAAIGGGLSG